MERSRQLSCLSDTTNHNALLLRDLNERAARFFDRRWVRFGHFIRRRREHVVRVANNTKIDRLHDNIQHRGSGKAAVRRSTSKYILLQKRSMELLTDQAFQLMKICRRSVRNQTKLHIT